MQQRSIIKKKEWDGYYYHSAQFPGQKKIQGEDFETEKEKVLYILKKLKEKGVIPHYNYDIKTFIDFRKAVKESFFIFWTAISPPMEHLLFALSDILRPKSIVALGIFTGNPAVWPMGPALLGKYPVDFLIAVEIDKNNARLCADNFSALGEELEEKGLIGNEGYPDVKVYGEDAFKIIPQLEDSSVELLYLDANGYDPVTETVSKNINYSLLKEAYGKIVPGGYVECHNSYQPSFRREAGMYLDFTADPEYFSGTFTLAIDEMGLEFSIKKGE